MNRKSKQNIIQKEIVKDWFKKFVVNNNITVDNIATYFKTSRQNIYNKISNGSIKLIDILEICNYYKIKLTYTKYE